MQDAAGLLGDAAQQRRRLAAAADDPGRVREPAGAPRELGDLLTRLEQPPGTDQHHARREGEDHGDQPVRPQLGVHRTPVPDVVEAHRSRGQQGDQEDAELVVSRIRHAGRRKIPPAQSIGPPSAARLSRGRRRPALAAQLTRRRRQAVPARGLRPAPAPDPPARTRPSRRARGRSATTTRRPGGPSRAGRSEPSLPPRLSIACTTVASRVRGRDRAAVLEQAVVREHDVQHRPREVGREARDALDLRAHDVVAERDLAEQLAVVGEVDRERVARVGLDLADVVDQRAGHRHVAVDARETRSTPRSRPGPPTACARAVRAGRPGGRTSPPAPCGSAATCRRPRRTARRAAARRYGLRTVSIRRRRSASIWSTLVGGRVDQVGEAVVAVLRRTRRTAR